ncbi:hypothetical protein Tco_0039225 [Tanacetum coccineum]
MEVLHMALNDGLAVKMFHGIKVGSPGMHISYLFNTDDVTIHSEWNLNAMENIIRIRNIFYIASGLKINIHKSIVYGVGVSSNEVEIMASYTVCEAGFFPFTYLGLTIGSNMRSLKQFLNLSKVHVLLSFGVALPRSPKWLLNLSKVYVFLSFWGSSENSKKLVWVKWSNILASLDKGGLSVGSLKVFNMSLLLKWRWHLFHCPNALWVHVVKTIHGDEACIDIRGCHTNRVWASIVGSIFHLHSSGIVPLNSIRFKVNVVRPKSSSNSIAEIHKKKSYASITHGDISTRETRHNNMKNVKSVQLDDCDLIKVEDASTLVMVKIKEIDTIRNMYHVCRNEGFDDIKIHHIGGLWVWIQFNSEKSCASFKSNESLKKLWITSQEVSSSFVVDERIIWIKIYGLPLCA